MYSAKSIIIIIIILAMKEYLSYQINDIKNQENSLEKVLEETKKLVVQNNNLGFY